MIKRNYFVLTGAMGAGKSAIIECLLAEQYRCVEDPARQILREQRSIAGRGVPEIDAALFNELMLSRAMYLYGIGSQIDDTIVFDRGIPDLIAYAGLFDLNAAMYERAAEIHRYNPTVFYFAGWADIYTLDDERKMDFESASRFGDKVLAVYTRLGYRTIEVPRVQIQDRVRFLVNAIKRERKDE